MTQKKPDEPQFFVSRRGRHVGLHEVDLQGIDVEHDEPSAGQSATEKPKPRHTEKAVEQPARARTRVWTRKKATILLTVVAALIAAPVVAAELVAIQYREGVDSAKRELDSTVQSEVLPMQKQPTVPADKLRAVAGRVDEIAARMCRGGMLDNIAGLYPRAKTAHDDCKAAQRNYTALAKSLFDLESQARYLERLEGLLRPVTTPITDEYAVISAQQTSWRTAADGIKKLSPPVTMASAHTELNARTSAIADAWAALATANNSQSATGFTEAEQTLSAQYEALRATSERFTEVINDTQAKVTAAYKLLK